MRRFDIVINTSVFAASLPAGLASLLAYAVLPKSANIIVVIIATFLITYISGLVVSMAAFLRVSQQQKDYVLERERLALEARSIELKWQERQQTSYDLQLGMAEPAEQTSLRRMEPGQSATRRKISSGHLALITLPTKLRP